MAKTKDIAHNIETVRGKVAALKAERARVKAAPLPRKEVQERVRAEVARLGSGFRPDVSGLLRPAGDPPDLLGVAGLAHGSGHVAPNRSPLFSAQLAQEVARGTVALLAALAPQALEDRLMAAVDEELGEKPAGLPSAERPELLAKLDAELLRLEIAEEQFIEATERDGRPVKRRADANPAAVLGLEDAA